MLTVIHNKNYVNIFIFDIQSVQNSKLSFHKKEILEFCKENFHCLFFTGEKNMK